MNTKAINAMIQTHKLSCISRRKGNFVCSCGTELEAMVASPAFTEKARILGKIEGLKLALGYFEEMNK